MRFLGSICAALVCIQAMAANSDLLVRCNGYARTGGRMTSFSGTAGNLLWNGQNFVTAAVQTNGRIHIVVLDELGFAATNAWSGVSGTSPRIAFGGTNYLLTWIDTNGSGAQLLCAPLNSFVAGPSSVVSAEAAPETVSVRAAEGQYLVVWQTIAPPTAIMARWLAADGTVAASPFAISESAAAQRHPSMNAEGTHYLVCWMEQTVPAGDWKVMARFTDLTGALGTPITISETNSLRPRGTACSFGTNFLVAWSADDGPHSLCELGIEGPDCPNGTNLWFAMVYGRMAAPDGTLSGHTLTLFRNQGANTNVALTFGGGQYLAAVATGAEHAPLQFPLYLHFDSPGLQPLAADGSRQHYPIPAGHSVTGTPQVGFGGGTFCFFEPQDTSTFVRLYQPASMDSLRFRVQRNGSAYSFELMGGQTPYRGTNVITGGTIRGLNEVLPAIEFSTNLIDWAYYYYTPIPPNPPSLYFRCANREWECFENLRAIFWAKKQWTLDNKRRGLDFPAAGDIYGPGRYLPAELSCPNGLPYTLNMADSLPICPVLGHVME